MENGKFIFTVGRMNPPTPGHLLLIEYLIYKAIEEETYQATIFLSRNLELPKNPITCPNKKVLLEQMIERNKQFMILQNPEKREQILRTHLNIICVPDDSRSSSPVAFAMGSITGILKNSKYSKNKLYLILGEGETEQKTTASFVKTFSKGNTTVQSILLPRSEMESFKEKILTGEISSSHEIWQSINNFKWGKRLSEQEKGIDNSNDDDDKDKGNYDETDMPSLSHHFKFFTAAGFPKYTNYTRDFSLQSYVRTAPS